MFAEQLILNVLSDEIELAGKISRFVGCECENHKVLHES